MKLNQHEQNRIAQDRGRGFAYAMITAPPPGPSFETPTRFDLGYIWLISLVAAMGGLLFGYDWVVVGGAKPFFEPYFGITRDLITGDASKLVTDEAWSGWANSCALLGCLGERCSRVGSATSSGANGC